MRERKGSKKGYRTNNSGTRMYASSFLVVIVVITLLLVTALSVIGCRLEGIAPQVRPDDGQQPAVPSQGEEAESTPEPPEPPPSGNEPEVVTTIEIEREHIDETPPQEEISLLERLEDIIGDDDWGVFISISWTDGPYAGQETEFEGVPDEGWVMNSATGGSRQVYPEFLYDGDVFEIGFPTTTRKYYFFEDGTGFFAEPDGSRKESFTWDFFRFCPHC